MELYSTIALAAGFAGVAAFSGWRGARPPNPHRGPRLMPWRMLMLLSAAGAIFAAGHVVGLLKGGG